MIDRLIAWLSDPSHNLGILVMLVLAVVGHVAILRWTTPGSAQRALELAFALFLFLSALSIGRGRGWGQTAVWLVASAMLAGMLGAVFAAASP